MQHQYKIRINDAHSKGLNFTYRFGATNGIILIIEKDAAQIAFGMTVAKKFEDIVGLKVRLVHDAMRKVQLLHVLMYGTGLNISKIVVFIDQEKQLFDKNNSLLFPFLFSILPKEDFDPKRIWNTPELTQTILSATKSTVKNDLRFSSMYAFLGAMSKEYEIDRFSGLWTSMNAFYNYVVNRSDEILATTPTKKPKSEVDRIAFLLQLLGCGDKIPRRDGREKHKKAYYQVGNCLCGLSLAEIQELYTLLTQHNLERQANFKDDRFAPISNLAQKLSITPYGLMLLEYPYFLRCRYFHGEQATLLFSGYNDPEISALRVVNYILKEFLLREIPQMFQDDFPARLMSLE